MLLGRSVHSHAEVERERDTGAVDYVQFGPIFATPSKAAFGPVQGADALALAVKRAHPLAVTAVGGIAPANAGEVMLTGASGVAVIGAVMSAVNPGHAVHALLEAMRRP
jgi:thiamine-phosphate pyrophosphorylase